MTWRNDWTGFFSVYFSCCYYLCVTPLRFVWDNRQKRFRVTRNRFQSAACALQYLLLAAWYMKALRKIPLTNANKNPDVYFSLAFKLNAIYCHNVVFATIFWWGEENFLQILNYDSGHHAISTVKNRVAAVLLCCVFTVLPFVYTFSGYHVLPSSSEWSPSLLFQCLVAEGRFAFFWERMESFGLDTCGMNRNISTTDTFHQIGASDVILFVVAFLMESARQIFGFYADFFPLICSISLWTCVGPIRDFVQAAPQQLYTSAENSHRNSLWTDIESGGSELPISTVTPCDHLRQDIVLLGRYRVAKGFSGKVNRALGRLLFAYVFSSIMYLSTSMDAVLVLQDWFAKFRVAFFFLVFILMFFIGSEIVKQVDGVRAWLSDSNNNNSLSEKSLLVLINELTCKPIGISGNRLFTVTYSTFMTVMTTTVTFFIIILQFQKYDLDERDIPLQLRVVLTELLATGNVTTGPQPNQH